ncbi:MAG: tyrosine-type recombinase/integrase [Anaerolineae bacterium]|nr:tyrosine-type recombinase/integrase [Anaerolineae bacterium]
MDVDGLLARFEEHIVELGMAPATIANYAADLQNFVSWCDESTGGRLPLLRVSTDDVRQYCHALKKQGRSISTINRRLQAVRKFYDYAVQAGLSSHNPARDVDRVTDHSASSPRVLTPDQVNQLLQAINSGNESLARRDRAIVLLLLDAGIKVRELVDLQMQDVDLDVGGGYLWVGQDLESGGRALALGPEACAAMRSYLRLRAPAPGVDCVFVSRQGQPLSPRTVQRLVSGYAQAAGLGGVSAQTLRYTFAHDALEERDLSDVARLLGLRDAAGVRRYLG